MAKIEIIPMIPIVSNPFFADFTAAFVLIGYLSFCAIREQTLAVI